MAKTEWTKEYPSLKYGSWFWLRDAPDAEPELRQLTGGRNWMEAFGAVRDSTEFLGPVTAADFEQLTRLREAAAYSVDVLDLAEAAMTAAAPYCARDLEIAIKERVLKVKNAITALREALAPRNTGGK